MEPAALDLVGTGVLSWSFSFELRECSCLTYHIHVWQCSFLQICEAIEGIGPCLSECSTTAIGCSVCILVSIAWSEIFVLVVSEMSLLEIGSGKFLIACYVPLSFVAF